MILPRGKTEVYHCPRSLWIISIIRVSDHRWCLYAHDPLWAYPWYLPRFNKSSLAKMTGGIIYGSRRYITVDKRQPDRVVAYLEYQSSQQMVYANVGFARATDHPSYASSIMPRLIDDWATIIWFEWRCSDWRGWIAHYSRCGSQLTLYTHNERCFWQIISVCRELLTVG